MRFVLDEDVDAAVARLLASEGHDAWTIHRANLSASSDEVVAVYGHERGNAVVITHDAEFSRWRRKNCVGRHLYLRCEEPDAVEVVEQRLPEMLPVLERHENVYAEASVGGLWFDWSWG